MTITLEQFVEQLADSRLLSADELTSFRTSLSPERQPDDAETFAKELVRAEKLTEYQAAAICRGESRWLILGEYVVLDKIGQGGMGEVLKAQHRKMKRIVAVKVLPAKALENEDAVKRFFREVEAAARLTHPNVVTAYDASEPIRTHRGTSR